MLKKIVKKTTNLLGLDIRWKTRVSDTGSLTMSRYFKYQKGDLNYFETPIGNYFLPNDAPGDGIINAMKNGIYFEECIIEVARKYIKPGTVVIDIGANLGQMSICFSQLTGPSGKVYSFDADDYIFEVFKKNIAANNCDNIVPTFGAVFNIGDQVLRFPKQDFVKYPTYGSYGVDPKANFGREVKSITIDSLNIDAPISFMKVDVQGCDLFAMQGCRNTIKKNKMPIIFEFEQELQKDFGTTFQDYVEFADDINYKFAEVVNEINYVLLPK